MYYKEYPEKSLFKVHKQETNICLKWNIEVNISTFAVIFDAISGNIFQHSK